MKGVAVLEEVAETAAAAVRTLECSICLDILTTPVAAGCGHCFCRKCVSRILLSSYRAPCPLCKRSFTRRGVCDSHVRHVVITCAKALAEDCNSMTVDDLICLKYSEESKEFMDASAVSPEKNKSLIKEVKDVLSKKRKSCENEGHDSHVDSSASVSDMKELTDKNLSIDRTETNEFSSAKKRAKSSRKEADSDSEENELPSLENLLSQIQTSPKESARIVLEKVAVGEPLKIIPPHKIPKLKTNSQYQKKLRNTLKVISFTSDCSETDIQEVNAEVMGLMTFGEVNGDDVQNYTNDLQDTTIKPSKKCPKLKRINALKNKTNEVESTLLILKDDGFLAKPKDVTDKTEHEAISKENEICSSPRVISGHSNKSKKLKKNRVKVYNLRKKSRLSTDEKVNTINHELLDEGVLKPNGKIIFSVDENTLSTLKETQHKSSNDSYKVIGLTDTAVSVDSVTSPLAAKTISLHKTSPGWSRVKKVKKDFKMRQFSSLPIEKSSPSVANKHYVLSVNSTAQNSINKNDVAGKRLEFDHQHEPRCDMKEINNKNSVQPVNNVVETHAYELMSVDPFRHELELGKVVMTSGTDESHTEFMELADPVDIDVQKDVINCQKKSKEIVCTNVTVESDVESNISYVDENKNNFFVSKNSNGNTRIGNLDSYVPQISSSEILSSTCVNDTFSSAGKSSFINMNNKNFQNNENFGELNVVKNPSTSINEGNGNDKVVSEQSLSLYDSSGMHDTSKLRKEKTVTLQACISEYKSYNTQMVLSEDKEIQHVEHSQQTSQMQYNFEHANPVYNNFPLSVQQAHEQFCTNVNTEKTKVVKRTCLTLDEIQDSFIKSNQSGCSETIYSSLFLHGQFKLDVCVSDETLNISVLKIVDPRTENSTALSSVSMIYEKSVQTSDGLSCALSPTVLPSSNSSSQPDNSNAVLDPYPYLNKVSSAEHLQPKSVFPEDVDVRTVESSAKKMESLEEAACHTEKNYLNEENVKDNNFNTSEIVHYPNISANKVDKQNIIEERNEDIQNWSDSSMQCCQSSTDKILKTSSPHYHKNDFGLTISTIPKEVDVDMCLKDDSKDSKEVPHSLFSQSMNKSSKLLIDSDGDELSDSDEEVTLKVLQQCVKKEPVTKKQSRLSLREKFRKTQVYVSSEESDAENHELTKNSPNRNFSCSSVADKPLGEILAYAKNFQVLNMPVESLKSSGTLEMPCTLNSILSEDAPDANASEIVLEIEDLSDKIKLLEEKLKQCGHVDLLKSQSSAQKLSHNGSTHASQNLSLMHGSDSEDLFSQSVPPTPPEKCGNDASPGYKSSFYNDN